MGKERNRITNTGGLQDFSDGTHESFLLVVEREDPLITQGVKALIGQWSESDNGMVVRWSLVLAICSISASVTL